MQQDGELTRHSNNRAFLSVLAAALGQMHSRTLQIAVRPESSEQVLRAQHQKRAQLFVARLADSQLLVDVA
jgi:hypothetical protein